MIAVSIDGELVAPEQATISIFDRGLLYGDGVFEVVRTWDGVPVDLAGHLDRMFSSAGVLGLRTLARPLVEAAVSRTIAAAGPPDHRIRVMLTRGPGPVGARLGALGPGRAIVIVEPLPVQPTELALAVVDWPLPRRAGGGHKTLAYLDHLIARELAAAAGADEAVRLGADGDVVECATANLFIVAGSAVVTPSIAGGILPGITRGRVLAACATLGLAAREERITLPALYAADEIFVTSALRGVAAVMRLDGVPRAQGPVTAQVRSAYLAGVQQQTVTGSTDPLGPPTAI